MLDRTNMKRNGHFTVAELIKALETADPDAVIAVFSQGGCCTRRTCETNYSPPHIQCYESADGEVDERVYVIYPHGGFNRGIIKKSVVSSRQNK